MSFKLATIFLITLVATAFSLPLTFDDGFYHPPQAQATDVGAVVSVPTKASPTRTATPALATPTGSPSGSPGITITGSVAYTHFKGDGSPAQGWPTDDKWVTFDSMFTNNTPLLAKVNSAAEIKAIRSAIESQSKATGVDPRLILAVIMEESTGNLYVKTTISPDGTVHNPGIMQCHEGVATCFGLSPGTCPAPTILAMITEGVSGTAKGDGLSQTFATAKTQATGARAAYIAARIYNSGNYEGGDLAGGRVATPCYASDIANLMVGFVGDQSPCKLNLV
ncbi:hypothetical protein BGZ60DRAFT_383824 [Tricladium varicosporioides]|nr:hypothetical protein BGZ60DRAFT_383824 [Hymenoscyphus varicosporioides]